MAAASNERNDFGSSSKSNENNTGDEKKTTTIDWEKQNDRFRAERIFDECLSAIADGNEDALQACLMQIESEKKVATLSKKLEKRVDDSWNEKIKQIVASRVLDDAMSAIASGDVHEIEATMGQVDKDVEFLEKE